MLSYRELYSQLQSADLDTIARELVRFGNIIADKSYDIAYGFYMGAHRTTKFMHVGHEWEVKKHNGNVISVKVVH